MVRMRLLRDWDAICEEGGRKILGSEVMEEEMMWWNVSLLPSLPILLRGATE